MLTSLTLSSDSGIIACLFQITRALKLQAERYLGEERGEAGEGHRGWRKLGWNGLGRLGFWPGPADRSEWPGCHSNLKFPDLARDPGRLLGIALG